MDTLSQLYCFLVMFIIQTGASPYDCDTSALAERLSKENGSFINITYFLDNPAVSTFADNSDFYFSLCQNNEHEYRCKFEWSKRQNYLTVKKYGTASSTFCSAERRNLTWVIRISQVVSWSLSVIYFYNEDDRLQRKTIKETVIKAVCPTRVTHFAINGQEVNDTHLIDEGQKVSVFCSFYKGSPPVTFRLADKANREVISDVNSNGICMEEDQLNFSLSVDCEDNWPTVVCEGSGSTNNRSVSFLVRCTPQFLHGPFSIVPSELEKVRFHVKAHTTSFNECRLLPDPSENTFIPKGKCILTGNPPDLVLRLFLEGNITQGNWRIVLSNEAGSGNTSITITEESSMYIKTCLNYRMNTQCTI
ncbi:uncharacterized protein LOC112568867 isoform X2 [Pomacea canaliculata]|uniref:uncharacterized protein LOC112568867 isoform X2 n=1 Tax=Pomacea canaliculata TaxID=400727 RepID=UPI000D72FF8A|nr:uncharacterized protein LOC112568867 isoform X2 [Pomacea canaliculata]